MLDVNTFLFVFLNNEICFFISAGPAALGAIESLRLNGFTGEIVMVSKGTKMPYDKTRLSKSFKNLNYDNLTLRDEEWFDA